MKWGDRNDETETHQDKDSSQICVDAGGVLFYTLITTLKQSPYFARNITEKNIKSQYIFIDRDPHIFHYILTYLRTGIAPYCEEEFFYESLKEESRFFGLNDMEKSLKYVKKETIHDLVHEVRQLRTLIQTQQRSTTRTRSHQDWSH